MCSEGASTVTEGVVESNTQLEALTRSFNRWPEDAHNQSSSA